MRWQPGQSGNPHGRPRRGRSVAETLERYMKREKRADRLVEVLFDLATVDRSVPAIRMIFEVSDITEIMARLDALEERQAAREKGEPHGDKGTGDSTAPESRGGGDGE